jgi:epoxyqueuosine reductase
MAAGLSPTLTPAERSDRVRRRARALGFDTVGVADLAPLPHAEVLDRWLAEGMAGTMGYMHRQAARRRQPARILAGASYAVIVTRNYFTPDPGPVAAAGRVAKYARGPDYHRTLDRPLRDLADFVMSLGPPGTRARPYVDAGPVPERELAQRAGLGWIGKNTMLIDPHRGSYLFLAAVLTDLDLETDPPFLADHCGTCTRCLDACPTGAFREPRLLDATRCIAYLTIEHRGDTPPALAAASGDWIFGCDICQDVCPWNGKFAAPSDGVDLGMDGTGTWIDLDQIAALTEIEFTTRFGETPLVRPGLDGLRRNARVAAQNLAREGACQSP